MEENISLEKGTANIMPCTKSLRKVLKLQKFLLDIPIPIPSELGPKSWNSNDKVWNLFTGGPSGKWRTCGTISWFPKCSAFSLSTKDRVVDLLMRQSLKSKANCPTSWCCCSSGIHTSCLQPAIFQMWLLKEFFSMRMRDILPSSFTAQVEILHG